MGRFTALRAALALSVAALAIFGLGQASAGAGAATANITISPSTQSAVIGDTVVVNIQAENVTGLAGYEFAIQFNPSVLQFLDQSDGGFAGSTGRQMNCPAPIIDNTLGLVRFGCGSLNTTPEGPSGDGRLATARFTATGDGTSDLVFLKAELANFNGDNCCGFPTVEEAAVAVGEDEEPPLPPTPVPDPDRRNTENEGGELPPYELLDGTTDAVTSSGASGSGSSGTASGSGAATGTTGSAAGAAGSGGSSAGAGTGAGEVAGSESSNTASSAGGVPVAGHGPPPSKDYTPLVRGASLIGLLGMALVALALGLRWAPNARRKR